MMKKQEQTDQSNNSDDETGKNGLKRGIVILDEILKKANLIVPLEQDKSDGRNENNQESFISEPRPKPIRGQEHA